ncbi:MAG: hypothetical protein J2P14_09620 [Acidothermales bacterium]|nr:hypothetical protein [Acidothermales bacterium]
MVVGDGGDEQLVGVGDSLQGPQLRGHGLRCADELGGDPVDDERVVLARPRLRARLRLGGRGNGIAPLPLRMLYTQCAYGAARLCASSSSAATTTSAETMTYGSGYASEGQ